jgi:predicted  nucleic acid-binding Zn-ribbon protein
MGYRGEDLDLRTPQTWSATAAELAGSTDLSTTGNGQRSGYRSGPIWVDETVLACSNHAFDVALAHRSGDVRIEHLLHAMTRIDAAAEALEARGVRVAALRRESATIIASEIPVGLPNGKGTPRRSEQFAEVLRLAAASAARRNAPAAIDDLINVLFDPRLEFSSLGLLTRHTTRSFVREVAEAPRFTVEPRYVPVAPEPVRYAPEPVRSYRTDLSGSPTDAIQNSRIEALEQMVRALSADLSNERQVFSGMLQGVSRDTQASRDDQGRLHAALFERLQSIETALGQGQLATVSDGASEQHLAKFDAIVERRLRDMAKTWTALTARVHELESAVRQTAIDGGNPALTVERIRQAIDLTPLSNRLDIIEEAVLSREQGDAAGTAVRLEALEVEITRALAASAGTTERMEQILSAFESRQGSAGGIASDRIAALTNILEAQQSALTRLSSDLNERLSAVEQAVAAEIQTAAAKHQAYSKDLVDVHDALMKLNQNQHTLAGSIDQWRADAASDVAIISNRLAAIDRDNDLPAEKILALSDNMDNLNRLMVERYHRRNRFWFWLFGTDDWLGRSWPSQVHAIEAEKQRLKDVARTDAEAAA